MVKPGEEISCKMAVAGCPEADRGARLYYIGTAGVRIKGPVQQKCKLQKLWRNVRPIQP